MTCFYCNGETEEKTKIHAATLEKCVIIIKNVPAHICKQCGEAYFTGEVVQKLENIVDRLEDIIKEVAIVDYVDSAA
ncbi:MAG: type II toxin-antitoxin system MqsA family antitoxin [Defluviitaleaceae bacterium]|nr:type II toxin-antitoxin system MqsA family antitoxin [Defluviitaleaceae bacterium]